MVSANATSSESRFARMDGRFTAAEVDSPLPQSIRGSYSRLVAAVTIRTAVESPPSSSIHAPQSIRRRLRQFAPRSIRRSRSLLPPGHPVVRMAAGASERGLSGGPTRRLLLPTRAAQREHPWVPPWMASGINRQKKASVGRGMHNMIQ